MRTAPRRVAAADLLRVLPRALLLGALLLGASGCATPVHRALERDPDIVALGRARSPLVFRVAVASPIVMGAPGQDGATRRPRPVGREDAVSPRPVDRAALQGSLVAGLKAARLFREVVLLRPAETPRSRRGERQRLAMFARELGANFVLLPRVRAHEVAFAGRGGWWIPSTAAFLVLWFPSFFIPDELYRARVSLELELVDARTEEPVWGPETYTAEVEDTFDDFARGWDLLGPLGIPLLPDSPTFGAQESNWSRVAAALLPGARGQAAKRFLLGLGAYLAKVKIAVKGTAPQSIALVVGVDRYRSGAVPPLIGAVADARAVARLLEGGRLEDVPAKNIHLLLNEQATLKAVRDFLRGALLRTAPADQVVLYFAGYGGVARSRPTGKRAAATEARPMLALFDSDPARLGATGLSIEELAKALDETPARRVLVVVDASFGGRVPGRTLPSARASDAAPPAASALRPLAARPGRFVLLAGGPQETAQEYADERRGIYTYLLEEGVRELQAERAGRRVSLADLQRYLRDHVGPTSALLGQRQEPLLLGDEDDAKGVVIWDPRRRRHAPSTPR